MFIVGGEGSACIAGAEGTVLNDYEKSFVLKMRGLKREGVDFERLTRRALEGKFGGATVVLLRDLSPAALEEPEHFVTEVSRIFGRGGSMGVYEPMVKYADRGLYETDQDDSEFRLLHQVGPLSGEAGVNKTMLHQHRIEDEEGNYADNAD